MTINYQLLITGTKLSTVLLCLVLTVLYIYGGFLLYYLIKLWGKERLLKLHMTLK